MNPEARVKALWFKRFGWVYRPVSLAGWVATIGAAAFLVQIFAVLDAQSHSVSDLFYKLYVFAAPTFLGLMWIGSRTSDEKGGVA